jgi:hypothetical protein
MSDNFDQVPGVGTLKTAQYRQILWSADDVQYVPGGVVVDGSVSRDPGNTNWEQVLRAGLLLGRVSSSNKYAPATLGTLPAAYSDGTSTQLTVSPATAVELARRIQSAGGGSFKLTGPAATGGTVRTLAVSFSAINTTSGVATITPLGSTGLFAAGSLVQPADGSETIRGILGEPWGLLVTDAENRDINLDVRCGRLVIGGKIDPALLIDYPSDPAIEAWIKSQLRVNTGGTFIFRDDFISS